MFEGHLHPVLIALLGYCLSAPIVAGQDRVSEHWTAFSQSRDRSNERILTDYSYAGYHHGESGIPDISGPVFKVTDFGTVPDSPLSSEEAIRKAIEAASKAGGGVVLFPKGRFLVWTDRHKVAPIRISSPGIVLRGAGSGAGGTVIRAVHSGYGTGPYPVPKDGSDFLSIPHALEFVNPASADGKPTKLLGGVKRSDHLITVDSAAEIGPGDWVMIRLKSKDLLQEMLAGQIPSPLWTRLQEGIVIREVHQVEAIEGVDGKVLRLKEPVLLNLPAEPCAEVVPVRRMKGNGVEDIAFEGGWRQGFFHHRSALDDEGWDAILMKGLADSWVRRCSFLNVSTAVYLRECSACSLLENRIAGSVGHYDLASRADTSFNLLGLCRDDAGARHAASCGNHAAGNVIWRWNLMPDQSIDSHGNGPYASLVDRVDGGTMTTSGGPTPGFPHYLRWLVFWNFDYQGKNRMPVNFWDLKKGVAKFAKPLFVGIHGKPITFVPEALEGNASPGRMASPESLYEAQLELRLGSLPAWVGSTRREWAGMRTAPLPPFGTPKPGSAEIIEEQFDLHDLLTDVGGLMAGQEQDCAVTMDFAPSSEALPITRDYVLLRTILQQMATYACRKALPANGNPGTPEISPSRLPCTVRIEGGAIMISMPLLSDEHDHVKNGAALEVAKSLAPACRASLGERSRTLTLRLDP